jgi:hypothetical protein
VFLFLACKTSGNYFNAAQAIAKKWPGADFPRESLSSGQGHLQADEHHGKSEALHDDGLDPFGHAPAGGYADEAADKDSAAVCEGSDHALLFPHRSSDGIIFSYDADCNFFHSDTPPKNNCQKWPLDK